jgi:hypothetical protein
MFIAIGETVHRKSRDAGWKFEVETDQKRVFRETSGGDNSDVPTNTESVRRVEIADQLATVSPQQATVPNQKVGKIEKIRECVAAPMDIHIVEEFD